MTKKEQFLEREVKEEVNTVWNERLTEWFTESTICCNVGGHTTKVSNLWATSNSHHIADNYSTVDIALCAPVYVAVGLC